MKLKSNPEDFIVEELTDFFLDGGPYAFYRLEKRSLGTPEAAQAIASLWKLPRDAVKHGGLKDRHAETTQHVSILRGPRENLEDRSFRLTYIGQATRHFTAQDIVANRFEMVLRGFSGDALALAESRLASLETGGLVNYFDDQRFGSLGISGQFIAQPWCLGDYERALYLAIAEPNVHDRPREKEQKAILRDNWNNWPACKNQLDKSHRRSIVTFLADHPTDFKRAIALLRPDLRSIYLSAFQSFLWNRWLSEILKSRVPAEYQSVIASDCGPLIAIQPERSEAEQTADLNGSTNGGNQSENKSDSEFLEWIKQLSLPLPSARQHDWPEEYLPLLQSILQELNMTTSQIRLKYPRDTFFSRGSRNCWLEVDQLHYEFKDSDDKPNVKDLQIGFTLPRGAYATMVVKYLT